LALRSDGILFAWGTNGVGQLGDGTTYIISELGDGTTTNRSNPVQVSGLSNILSISTKNYHTLAIKSDGTVWAWGHNTDGQLGDGTTTTPLTPVQVSGLSNVSYVSAGSTHSLAIKSDGTVWAWGNNADGQFGDGTMGSTYLSPVQVAGLSEVTAVSTSAAFTVAQKSDGTVWASGHNYWRELGDGTRTDHYAPAQVTGL
jgi:alpha-tubulin suppressor-like RCC1 family protein